MKDKLTTKKVNLRLLLNQIEAIKIPGQVRYEIEQKVKEFSEKIYEMADLLEEIDSIIHD